MTVSEQFARVIVDVPGLPELDYKVPAEQLLAVGDIVMVPVGRQQKAGIVTGLRPWTDIENKRLRSVSAVRFGISPLSSEWLSLTRFASHYYCRTWGEVAIPALPTFFRKKPGVRYQSSLEKIRTLPAPEKNPAPAPALDLNPEQKDAIAAILTAKGFQTWLLFGVTGSGKTEIYLQVMRRVLEQSPQNQVLLLVPEINLTPQLEERVRSHFADESVVVLNSDLPDAQRARSWLAVHEGRARILVGTRMAALASFRQLALIVVDEEHDLSYKGGDGARYSARDLSVKRAQSLGIPVILGSATPSLESWSRARSGSYRLLTLSHKAVSKAEPPRLRLVDTRTLKKGEVLSEEVKEAIGATLQKHEQVLVYINRRGFSPVLMCPSCGWKSACPHCSAFMVFHKDTRSLVCHHCGYTQRVPARCPGCGAADILPVGIGTQRIEEEIGKLWPDARRLRIDRDNFKTKRSTDKAFQDVHEGKVDILIGTQMIAKGHDFKKVSLVVILNIDSQLISTDVRARERAFATMMQVSGRAGRAGLKSEVLVETAFPDDEIFTFLAHQDYQGFADQMLKIRKRDGAPPFVYQALLTSEQKELPQALELLRHAVETGLEIQSKLPDGGGVAIYDPVPMTIVKVANRNRAQLLIEGRTHRELLQFLRAWVQVIGPCSGGALTLEVDPQRY